MRRFIALTLTAVLPTALVAESSQQRGTAPIMAMGAYVTTDDMEESEAFYRALFDSDPTIGLPEFVAFNVAGGWFAIVSRDKYAPGSEAGSGAVPYLQSTDLEVLHARATSAGVTAPEIIEEPGIHLLKITDPNGQLIEFFRLTGQ
ncbi:VOC family protein [Ruegeria sp. 6PALISEP08]|uniref:VOC family protein n=1 Tax=Ruegeria sp. 6PALISEP08 TaxID=1225660 RepID=UPI00067F65AE|nr:glyoxalase/bleomycin resistance/dioxygenase family protein [Ruegeria sp. 6PALISEP08]